MNIQPIKRSDLERWKEEARRSDTTEAARLVILVDWIIEIDRIARDLLVEDVRTLTDLLPRP